MVAQIWSKLSDFICEYLHNIYVNYIETIDINYLPKFK